MLLPIVRVTVLERVIHALILGSPVVFKWYLSGHPGHTAAIGHLYSSVTPALPHEVMPG
jgi:hypothetical protein